MQVHNVTIDGVSNKVSASNNMNSDSVSESSSSANRLV